MAPNLVHNPHYHDGIVHGWYALPSNDAPDFTVTLDTNPGVAWPDAIIDSAAKVVFTYVSNWNSWLTTPLGSNPDGLASIVAGRTYTVSVYIYALSIDSGGYVEPSFYWYNIDGTFLGVEYLSGSGSATSGFVRKSGTFVAPAGAVWAGPIFGAGGASSTTYITGWQIEEGSSASAYNEGGPLNLFRPRIIPSFL